MALAKQYEKTFDELLLNVKDILRRIPETGAKSFIKWTEAELKLNQELLDAKCDIHNALCDNFDTRRAMESLSGLVTSTNIYIANQRSAQFLPNPSLLRSIINYLQFILNMFGASSTSYQLMENNQNKEKLVMPYLEAFSNFREDIRKNIRDGGDFSVILQICDKVRDDILPELGVRLEDLPPEQNLPPVIKLVDKEILLQEKAEKLQTEAKKQAEREQKRLEQLRLKEERENARKIPPSEIFLKNSKYSAFNEKGIPTHDQDGKELTKSALKKLMKIYYLQEKRYQEYLKEIDVEQAVVGETGDN